MTEQPQVGVSYYAGVQFTDEARSAMDDLSINEDVVRSILNNPTNTRWLESGGEGRMLSARLEGGIRYVIEHEREREETPDGVPAVLHTVVDAVYTVADSDGLPGYKGGDAVRVDNTGDAS